MRRVCDGYLGAHGGRENPSDDKFTHIRTTEEGPLSVGFQFDLERTLSFVIKNWYVLRPNDCSGGPKSTKKWNQFV